MIHALRGSRPVHALGAAAAVSGCVCCVGGLADALAPPAAIALLGATTVLAGTAGVIAWLRLRRLFRAVRAEVTERLDRVSAVLREGDRSSVTDGPVPATVTGHRINHIDVNWSDGDPVATVTATLFFEGDARGRLYVELVPAGGDRWQVVHVEGSGFRLSLE